MTLEYFKDFTTSLGFTLDFQVTVDYSKKEFDVLMAYEKIGNEYYSVMPEVVLTNEDLEEIRKQIFRNI